MFDKIHLRAASIDEQKLVSLGAVRTPGDGQYRKTLRLAVDPKKSLSVRLDPYYAPAKPSVELNPSAFESWSEVTGALEAFTGLDELLIDRIDYAVDLEMPFEQAWQSIRISRKQSMDSYEKGNSRKGPAFTGFKAGEKPEVFCIYDKACEVTKKWKFKKIPGAKFGDCTRIELRQYNQKVPFQKLAEILNYIDHDPFEKIDCRVLRQGFHDDQRFRELRIELEARGLDSFYAKYNSSGNFARTYGKYFESVPLRDQLRENHQSSLRMFLGESGSKVDKSRGAVA